MGEEVRQVQDEEGGKERAQEIEIERLEAGKSLRVTSMLNQDD